MAYQNYKSNQPPKENKETQAIKDAVKKLKEERAKKEVDDKRKETNRGDTP